jgi:succinate dehydrogenase/fumarate reductase flavoprotein subunit
MHPSQVRGIVVETLKPMERTGGESAFALKAELQTLMWEKAGLVRNARGLRLAAGGIDELFDRLDRASIGSYPTYNLEWTEYLNLRNLLLVSRLSVVSALAREESRGAHFRSDFPETDDRNFLKNVYLGPNFRVDLRPVRLSRMKPS